jgi:hypothetical protein
MQPKGSLLSSEEHCYWSLSWAKWIHSTPAVLISLRSILVLYSHQHLTSKYSSCTPVFLSTNDSDWRSLLFVNCLSFICSWSSSCSCCCRLFLSCLRTSDDGRQTAGEASAESLLELVTEWNTHTKLDNTQVCILICRRNYILHEI